MDEALIELVWERADSCCEYCQMSQEHDEATFEVDHIIALKHGGRTRASNLCLACFSCNSFKGPNVAGIDPRTRKLAPLFNPRRQSWTRHFRWKGANLLGRTPIGRATIAVLNINDPFRVELREELMEEGLFPPA